MFVELRETLDCFTECETVSQKSERMFGGFIRRVLVVYAPFLFALTTQYSGLCTPGVFQENFRQKIKNTFGSSKDSPNYFLFSENDNNISRFILL